MGRRKTPIVPLDVGVIREAFAVGDNSGSVIRRSTGAEATFVGPSGALLIRCYHQGQVRRLTASRVAWVLAADVNEWPKGPIKPRDGDERNLRAENLIQVRRSAHQPFSAGGKASSLERRTQADVALINALAEHQGALTVPQLSVSVGQSPPCCCTRLAKLEARGLVCGPHCDARKRWDLTPAGRALAAASIPVVIDDLDRHILGAVTRSPLRLMALAGLTGVCRLTMRRRLDRLIAQKLIEANESRFRISAKGREALGDDAPTPWVRIESISAAAAKDVGERSATDNRTSWQRSRLASKSRAKAKANRAIPFNTFDGWSMAG